MARRPEGELLLGEWACLGILSVQPAHGFEVAKSLASEGQIGRVWTLSRALTYRALDNLLALGMISIAGEEPGVAGGNKIVYEISALGSKQLRKWLTSPVNHLRDIRSELLLKILIADISKINIKKMLEAQLTLVNNQQAVLSSEDSSDPVALWRLESTNAAIRFLEKYLRN